MAKEPEAPTFLDARGTTVENLEAIRFSLRRGEDEGLIRSDDVLYNEMVELIDDAGAVDNWEELEELIVKAQVLEQDVDTWLSLRGLSTVSLSWPHRGV